MEKTSQNINNINIIRNLEIRLVKVLFTQTFNNAPCQVNSRYKNNYIQNQNQIHEIKDFWETETYLEECDVGIPHFFLQVLPVNFMEPLGRVDAKLVADSRQATTTGTGLVWNDKN